jgi:hypothetical protein
MNDLLDAVTAAFPDYEVTAVARPDRGCLVTLKNFDGSLVKRAACASQVSDDLQRERFVNMMKRDVALHFGELPPVETLSRLRRSGLPAYSHV